MILNVLKLDNDIFTRIAVIDNATSIIWVKRFNDVGEFELYIKASAELYELMQGDIFITRDDSDTGMIVEKIQLTTDPENGDYLTISGRSVEIILSWRIMQRAVYSQADTTAEMIIRNQISRQLIYNPVIINPGAIPWISLAAAQGYTDYVTRQYTGKALLDNIRDLCVTFDYGFKFVWTGSGFEFQLYKGTDRSFDQNENTFVVFSPEFENLGNTDYLRDTSNYANGAIIGGEGEGNDRVFVWVMPEGVEGYQRRVIFVDARNTSSDNGSLTENQYKKMLAEQAKEQLELRKVTTEFNGEILNYNNYTYGVDYNLGDKVSIKNSYGIQGNAVITEITEVEDENGYKLIPTLSEWTVVDYEEED